MPEMGSELAEVLILLSSARSVYLGPKQLDPFLLSGTRRRSGHEDDGDVRLSPLQNSSRTIPANSAQGGQDEGHECLH